jgi:hypothetical protein
MSARKASPDRRGRRGRKATKVIREIRVGKRDGQASPGTNTTVEADQSLGWLCKSLAGVDAPTGLALCGPRPSFVCAALWLDARRKLGRLLREIDKSAGPGRGKKISRGEKSFWRKREPALGEEAGRRACAARRSRQRLKIGAPSGPNSLRKRAAEAAGISPMRRAPLGALAGSRRPHAERSPPKKISDCQKSFFPFQDRRFCPFL